MYFLSVWATASKTNTGIRLTTEKKAQRPENLPQLPFNLIHTQTLKSTHLFLQINSMRPGVYAG